MTRIKAIGDVFECGNERYVPVDCIDEAGLERQFILSIDTRQVEEGAGLRVSSYPDDEGRSTTVTLHVAGESSPRDRWVGFIIGRCRGDWHQLVGVNRGLDGAIARPKPRTGPVAYRGPKGMA
jgi:hypothetical protein